MNPKAPVSIVIITKNEEKRIEECLQSVITWAEEIVVVDDGSTDKTLEIVKKYTSRIFQQKMENEGRHRNFAYDQATQPWVLSLDADERATPELGSEITAALATDPPHVCFAVPMKNYIGDEWISGAGYYPSARAKLFRKGKFKYEEARVHPRAIYQGSCGLLKEHIIHYSFRDISHWIEKFNRETTLEADKWMTDGRKVSFPNSFRKMIDRFFRNYILKSGWKCGFLGFLMCIFHSLYQVVTYAKYRELKRQRQSQPAAV